MDKRGTGRYGDERLGEKKGDVTEIMESTKSINVIRPWLQYPWYDMVGDKVGSKIWNELVVPKIRMLYDLQHFKLRLID